MTVAASPVRGTVRTFVELTKPRIVELLLITTVPAMVVAAAGWPGWRLAVVALVGGSLSAGGANVVNQVYDADIDRIMRRTSGRPLPTDRVTPKAALVFGICLGVLGSLVLWVGASALAGLLSAVAYLFYVLAYTMVLKRTTTQNIVIGGAAGAMPALIGWAAVTGDLSGVAWMMFAVIFFWTPPHFWALSLKYEEDYRAAGVPMLPVVVGVERTLTHIVWYSVVTTGVSLLLAAMGLGWIYATVAVAAGVGLASYALKLRREPGRAMRYFGFTNLYLAALFLSMMVDRMALDSAVPWQPLFLTAGAVAVVLGIVAVVVGESRPGMRAPGVSALRHWLEVSLTAAFAVVLIAVAIRSAGV